jgi:LacI family transcriptional regulator, galactose operon repressor
MSRTFCPRKALILCPGDFRRLVPLIDQAEKNNVRVICVASDAPGSRRSTVVWTDPTVVGRLAGDLMAKFLPRRSKVAIITGILQSENHRKKTEAFTEEFEKFCAGGKVIKVIEGHDDEELTFGRVLSFLRSQPSLGGFHVNTANCLPVCLALTTCGLLGKVQMIATDLFPEMVPYLEKGAISASIHQRPYRLGRVALRLALNDLIHKRPLPSSYCLTPQVVMRANVHLFRELRRIDTLV